MTLDTALCVCVWGVFVCLLVHCTCKLSFEHLSFNSLTSFFVCSYETESYWVTQVNLELEFPLRKSRLCWDPKHLCHVPPHKAIPFLKAFAHSLGNKDTKYSDISASEYVARAHTR